MNLLIFRLIIITIIATGIYGVYYLINENAILKKDNESLIANVRDTQEALFQLGKTVTKLNIEYSEATNNEFKKFNKSDINKIPMDRLVKSYNIGIKRVFKDYQNRTREFVTGYPKTTTP